MDANYRLITGEQPLPNGQTPPSRRKILGWLVAGINAVVGLAVIGPVLGFVASPLRRVRKQVWVPVLQDGELQVGETREVSFVVKVRDGYKSVDRKYTVFLRRFEDEVMAFDPSCTHLGCRIAFQNEKKRYFCPCHGGVFDDAGNVVSGPPPRPLERHPVKIADGKIWIGKDV